MSKEKQLKNQKEIDLYANTSFIMPAYNCASTVEESVKSIMEGNFQDGDELVIVNDCSTDNTERVLNDLKTKYPTIKILQHTRNKGGAAARNNAIENTENEILFCLDSDNVLVPGSIQKLKAFMENLDADIAAFQELHYFKDDKDTVTHKWIFKQGLTTLADYLSGSIVPGASGNYMFTKESWVRARGYPEFAGALDAWGFGFRQLATGSKMAVMPELYYYHRYGHESYWVRESKKGQTSLTAIKILIPFIDLINDKDVDYIMSRRGRKSWFDDLKKRPIRLKSGDFGSAGFTTDKKQSNFQIRRAKIIGTISRTLPNSIKDRIRGKK
jgi:glycosyltransferase involved in cell wall biosynthesis